MLRGGMGDSEGDAPQAVDAERCEAGTPEARHAGGAPDCTGEHENGERTQRMKANGFADAAFGEGEHGVSQAAQRTGTSGEPAKGADREIGRREEEKNSECRKDSEGRDRNFPVGL